MYPIHDHDPLLMLATALAAKRRPAEPLDLLAAMDLIQGALPGESKLLETITRLSEQGLLIEQAGGLMLSAAAAPWAQTLPLKAGYPACLADIRQRLTDYTPVAAPAIAPDAACWLAAFEEYRAAAGSRAKNLLMPKPAPEAAKARPGQRQRKPLPKAKARKR